MRSDITSELLRGSVDKFGKVRDAEKRAVLITLDRLCSFIPTIKSQYEQLKSKMEQQERKLEQRAGIHGQDTVTSTSTGRSTPF